MGNRTIRLAAAITIIVCAWAPASADNPLQAFARRWQGRAVVLRLPLYTLVYNERGKLGTTRNNRREGLTVVTPSNGVYYQFDGRQGRDDVAQRQVVGLVEAVNAAYQPDSLDVRQYRKIEPIVINRYDPGAEFVVTRVLVERDVVRVSLAASAADSEDPLTGLTVKWPVPISKSMSEGDAIDGLIRQFVEFSAPTR
jgi:hypothetical protein